MILISECPSYLGNDFCLESGRNFQWELKIRPT